MITKKSEHTPGPWKNHGWRVDIGGNTITLATPGITTAEADANAALIAAAPELLAALENARIALTFYKDEMYRDNRKERKTYPFGIDCEKAARAAIAKAKGE